MIGATTQRLVQAPARAAGPRLAGKTGPTILAGFKKDARAIFFSKGSMLPCGQLRQRLPPASAASDGEGTRGVLSDGKSIRRVQRSPRAPKLITVRRAPFKSNRRMFVETVVMSFLFSQLGPWGVVAATVIFLNGFSFYVLLPLMADF